MNIPCIEFAVYGDFSAYDDIKKLLGLQYYTEHTEEQSKHLSCSLLPAGAWEGGYGFCPSWQMCGYGFLLEQRKYGKLVFVLLTW